MSTFYKIIGVCSQIFDLIIRDWLEPPWSLESPRPKIFLTSKFSYLHFLQPHPINWNCEWVETTISKPLGPTFIHLSAVNLLSPNHPLVMGSSHKPRFTHLPSHILLGFSFLLLDCSHIVLGFFFCGANNTFVNLFSWSFCLQNGFTN